MPLDPFFKPLGEMVPRLGRVSRPVPRDAAPVDDEPPPPPIQEEKAKPKTAKLSNPKWEAEKVGFNEETPISVRLDLPPEIAHKTKVSFELMAKTPKGPEKISQGEANAKEGRAVFRIPVYIPSYQDEDGNRLQKVEYYFLARHSEAEPLDGSQAAKLVDEMADRVVESHILPDITFATAQSFLHPSHAAELKGLRSSIDAWKKKTPDGKLAIFGHADAVGKEADNKALSERRAKSLLAFLTLDAPGYAAIGKEEAWKLDLHQALLKHLGHDPGALDGQDGPKTQGAVKAFRKAQGMPESGGLDAAAKEKLYAAFFSENNPKGVEAKDFDDVNGNPYAGCSEFNLAENTQGACEKNRRVGVFLLKSNKNFPVNYPCAKGNVSVCGKQAGKKKGERRTPGFGCWFYDQLIVERPNRPPPPPDDPISDPKWDVESAWCGDTAKLTAGSSLADGAEVSIKLATEDRTCEEVKAKIQGGRLEFAWKVKNIAFSFDADKKARPEAEIFAEITAEGRKYGPKKNLKAKKLVAAKPEVFDKSYTWGQYSVHAHFTQAVDGNTQNVAVRKKALKAWGATYVDLSAAGITDVGGGFPWAGKRWARCKEGEMWPVEYWDGTKWKAIPASAKVDGSKFGTLPLVKKGSKFVWAASESAVWPGQMEDYAWEDHDAKRKAWIKDSNKRWTGVHLLKRKGCAAPDKEPCCAYEVALDFSFEKVESFANDVICLAPGSLRSNAGLLFYGDKRLPMAAHEVGHLVGLPDEYDKGAVDPNVNGDGAVNGLDATTLMGGDLVDPNNQIKIRHYSNFAAMARTLAKNNGGKDEDWIVLKKAAK